jgi:hypothetical protein
MHNQENDMHTWYQTQPLIDESRYGTTRSLWNIAVPELAGTG